MPKNNSFLPVAFYCVAIFLVGMLLASCGMPIVKNAPPGKHILYRNKFDVDGDEITRSEKTALLQRLNGQLEDSSKVKIKKKFFLFTSIPKPVAYDSAATALSCNNMLASLYHMGFYQSNISSTTDTVKNKITVTYKVKTGIPTRIDSVRYRSAYPSLEPLLQSFSAESYLKKGNPVTKANVITETGRLVDSFRNNGYYKFTTAELMVMGDTTSAALTSIASDPFEQVQTLLSSEEMSDAPKIKLRVIIPPGADSSRLQRFFIESVTIFSDFHTGDRYDDSLLQKIKTDRYTLLYHDSLFNPMLFERNISLYPGDLFRQSEYYKTIFNLTKLGLWQSVNIQVEEIQGTDRINLYVELAPTLKYRFETSLEVSYSAASNTSNILAGNLFGLSGNISLTNKNLAKDAIRMTHNIRAGVEFNNNTGTSGKLINSNEISYSNTTFFPRLVFPRIPNAFNKKSAFNNGESFVSFGAAYNTRLNLFTLQSLNGSFGWTGTNRKKWKWTFSPINIGFSIFNKSDSFTRIINENPFLKYSYNTALVTGTSVSFSKILTGFNHPNSLSKELSIRYNAEESGLTWGLLPLFTKYKRRYIKADAEIKHTIKYDKATFVLRGFVGIGIPLLGSDTNRTLPFFKQYFGGGSNSMRAWPVRGIGPGGSPLVPYSSNRSIFNDRTGDAQLEINAEYRFDIARIIPNTLTLRGAVFTDIGNIWNLRNTKNDGITDSTQFQFKNLYRQLGLAAGTGLRLDFNYFVLRFDMGFRFKRPELFYINDGWKAPNIGFDDFIKKIVTRGENDEYRKWRYENFNFTFGIGYSF